MANVLGAFRAMFRNHFDSSFNGKNKKEERLKWLKKKSSASMKTGSFGTELFFHLEFFSGSGNFALALSQL
ncbi:hypothetical protein [Bacteroides sp.]|uniref:hypothetical protein n=1 Tax=Bacteroides sp. TaxID=29523 RepID=UPI0025C1BCF1|nr:hypothetical protein [Bacteroides sp.]